MQKLTNQLIRCTGLAETPIRIYFATLELGQASIQQIAKKSAVKRTSIYNFLPILIQMGLILETSKKRRKVYSAMDPYQLFEHTKSKMNELESLLPELSALNNSHISKPRVTYYEGLEGTEEVYADMLHERKEIFAYEDLEHMKKAMRGSFFANWPSERAKRNIGFKSITRDSSVAREFNKQNIKLLRKAKFIQVEDLKTEINIYGDKVALMSFQTNPPFCVLIEDKNIAMTLKTMWQELWKKLDPVVG
jgi:sugar-specific transcriptional regulator TrmB